MGENLNGKKRGLRKRGPVSHFHPGLEKNNLISSDLIGSSIELEKWRGLV